MIRSPIIAPKSRNTLHLTSPELVREDWLSSGIANTDAIAIPGLTANYCPTCGWIVNRSKQQKGAGL
ncbi:MAG: hypothetical protein KME22_03875 [Hassallia sp. WJT32-NPBG1]|jgi:hypothetical protein|nr:hypothetical protein [Spirirestis rafaelensis WJT71-NPBG6]MBW4606370.1 hypothetical protein [Hassallia sp. WJT32-NPBG1]